MKYQDLALAGWLYTYTNLVILLQYISPPYPYYPQTIIPTMQMPDSEQASTAASPDEAYTQYSHPGGPK